MDPKGQSVGRTCPPLCVEIKVDQQTSFDTGGYLMFSVTPPCHQLPSVSYRRCSRYTNSAWTPWPWPPGATRVAVVAAVAGGAATSRETADPSSVLGQCVWTSPVSGVGTIGRGQEGVGGGAILRQDARLQVYGKKAPVLPRAYLRRPKACAADVSMPTSRDLLVSASLSVRLSSVLLFSVPFMHTLLLFVPAPRTNNRYLLSFFLSLCMHPFCAMKSRPV